MDDINNSIEFLKKFSIEKEQPELIYHYTTQNGLLGILNSKSLWISDIFYLNDKEEFIHASKEIQKEYRALAKENQNAKTILNSFIKIIDIKEVLKDYQIYVCSFSEDKDLLSQWRAYAPEDNGFSIGFSFQQLSRLIQDITNIGFYLYPCIYTEKNERELILEFAIYFLKDLKRIKMIETSTSFMDEIHNLIMQYLVVSSIMKDSSFKEEKEWRLLAIKNIKKVIIKNEFRISKSMIVPYIEFNFQKQFLNPIKEIIFGPTPHEELAENSLKYLKDQYELNVKIDKSKISYRNW